ncbi:DNA-directed RNA polymerase specialized sigma24 family protein [Bacillus altitudinis]
MDERKAYLLTLAMESGAMTYIHHESERIAGSVPDQTSFEQRTLLSVGYWLDRYRENGRDKRALIQRIIKRESIKYLKETRKRTVIAIDDSWEPQDVLADVEGAILLKEKTALLAQGDLRKEMILTNWSRGCTNNTEIAMLLAQHFGGNIEGNRKYIQRFRLKCQRELAS